MRAAARAISGLAITGALALGGCGGAEDAPDPGAKPAGEAAAPAPATPPQAPSEPLRETPPDPEAVGVEGELPGDVPVPSGAQPMHPPMIASGMTRASFELGESLAAVQAFYKDGLAAQGWSIEAEKALESQLLMTAKKDGRELSVAMNESEGRTQFVLLLVGE